MINPSNEVPISLRHFDRAEKPFEKVNVRYERVESQEPPPSNQGSIYDVVEISQEGLNRSQEISERPTVVKIKSEPANHYEPPEKTPERTPETEEEKPS